MMKNSLLISLMFLIIPAFIFAQNKPVQPVHPSFTGTGKYLGVSKALRDLPRISAGEFKALEIKSKNKQLNEKLKYRNYPYAATALPKGPDAAWQKDMGSVKSRIENPVVNFDGANSPYYPPDCNGTAGPNHFMQTINCVYTIYDKTGTLIAGPTNMNLLFGSVTGANYNDGDPIILYDEQADRWVATEFSISGSTNYMLMAVSTTNDPTGTWHQYSFQVANMPDYPKFSVWRDGYYMGDNNSSANDTYVFERSQMLTGGTAHVVGFNNPWRPSSVDGFMCVPPVDNDGNFAPAGSPGLYIAFNDDAFGGGTDQLWIYELHVDWTNTANSTFTRVQQIDVVPFDANFGNNWNNITQKGTSQKVDAIPQVIMNVPQYRNFGDYQTIVCCHTVDVDATNHAGIRWYELRKTTGTWSVRQTGTYAPDALNRWMGSIMLNNYKQIGLGYSVSSTNEYPGIRFCGQTPSAYNSANGILDIPEDTIWVGTNSQTGANRWGDYSQLSIDPDDDKTFWFTTEYIGSGGSRKTRIASFQFITDPTALTSRATNITGTSAQLNGIINPMNQETSYYFKYGESPDSLNDSTEIIPAGAGSDTLHVYSVINGLMINKMYYFRAVASFANGITEGSVLNFTTLNEPATLSVQPPVQNVGTPAGNTSFSVTANTAWSVAHSASWSTISFSGSGNDSIYVTFEENTSTDPRTDTLTVTSPAGSEQVLVVQEGIPSILSVTPENRNVSIIPGTTTFDVTSNLSWNAVSDASWCTVTPSGNGNGTITATFEANTNLAGRIATITVSGGTIILNITVTQSGIGSMISVTPPIRNVTSFPGTATFDVVSTTDWTVTSNSPWCTVTPSGSGNGTITATYSLNDLNEARTALIDVSISGIPAVQVSVVQSGPNGIGDTETENFSIYPNPATSDVTVIPGKEMKGKVIFSLLDVNGKEVLKQVLQNKKSYNINLKSVDAGLYQVVVKSDDKKETGKLLIRK